MKNPHILLTTDFSEQARRAFEPAAGLARSLGGRITLLHVVPELAAIPHGSPLAPAQEPPDLSAEIAEAKKRLAEERKRLGQEIAVQTALETGRRVDEAITGYAHEHGADLIALASHGRSGLRRMVLGSVAEGVLRRAKRPVIVFPA